MNIRSLLTNPGYYVNRALQRIELRTGVQCSKPSEVWLKLTERCNCRCQMCEIWKKNKSPDGELSTAEWGGVLRGLRDWLGRKHIWLTGGEVFMRPDTIDIIAMASDLGLHTGVITNGVLLSPEDMPHLVAAGLNEYHVSIDAMTPEIHDHLRGVKGAYERSSRNVMEFKEQLKVNGREAKIVIKTILMGYNVSDILPLVNWVEQEGFDEIKFQPLESNLESADNMSWYEQSAYWPQGDQLQQMTDVIDELIRRKQRHGRIYNSVHELQNMKNYFLQPDVYFELTKDHVLASARTSKACGSFVEQMEILSRGGLRMCRNMPPMGDVRKSSPRLLWKTRPRCRWVRPEFCPQ